MRTKFHGTRAAAVALAVLMAIGLMSSCSGGGETSTVSSASSVSAPSGAESGAPLDPGSDVSGLPGDASGEESGSPVSGGSGNQGDSSKPTNTESNGSAASQPPSEPGKNVVLDKGSYKVNSQNYPIVTDGSLELTVMMPYYTLKEFNETEFAKEMEKKTGIKVNYKAYNGYDSFVIKQTVLQSGNQPDIFLSQSMIFTLAEMEGYGKQGVVVDLSKYMDTWGTNIKKKVSQYPASKNFTYLSDGKVYALPGVYGTGTDVEEYQLMINKRWLDELGLSIPETTDDFYNVLKAFKTQDPNGDGKLTEEGFGIGIWTPQIWNPWGLNMSWYVTGTIDEKGNVESGPLTNQFREGIRYWKRLWDEGLINKNLIGTTGATQKAQFQKCGVVAGADVTDLFSESEWDDWVLIPWPKGNSGNYAAGVTQTNSGAKEDGVTTHACLAFLFSSTKAPEAALRWLDYLYTDEGAMLWHYGPVGSTYTKVGNNYKIMKGVEDKIAEVNCGSSTNLGGATNILPRNTAEMSARELFNFNRSKQAAAVNVKPKYSFYTLNQLLTADESSAVGNLKVGDVNWGYSAIRGEVNVETDWNNYLSQYTADYAKWKEVYQKAFARVYK